MLGTGSVERAGRSGWLQNESCPVQNHDGSCHLSYNSHNVMNVHGFREQIPVVRPLVPPTVPTHNKVVGISIIIMNIMTTFHDVAHDDDVQGRDQRGDSCWNRREGQRQR